MGRSRQLVGLTRREGVVREVHRNERVGTSHASLVNLERPVRRPQLTILPPFCSHSALRMLRNPLPLHSFFPAQLLVALAHEPRPLHSLMP